MNKKKKWASILTIATSLVLCIISTFGITLAFFGGNASANLSTITLKTGIEIGAAIESSVGSAKVVPGQPVKITATGAVSATELGNADANNAVDGVVRAKFNVGNELGEVTIAGNNTDFWTDGNDGYYYLVTAENGTTLRTVSKGTSVQIFGDLIVSKNFTNADSGKSVEASVIFEVIQADIYKTDGSKEALTVTNATTSTSPLYSSFEAVEYVEPTPMYGKEIETAYYNVDNIGEAYYDNRVGTNVYSDGYYADVLPYAIVNESDGVYLYYAFETVATENIRYITTGIGEYYWAQQNLGSAFPPYMHLIQDETYLVRNLNSYENVIIEDASEEYRNGSMKEGPVIIVINYGTSRSVDFYINNIDKLMLYLTTAWVSRGSN